VLAALIIWRILQQNAQIAAQERQRALRATTPPTVEYAVAQTRDIVNTYQTTGTVQTTQDVRITPKVTGRIIFLQVHEGDVVATGQVLVRIDPTQLQAQVQQQRATLAESEHRLAQAQATQQATNVTVEAQIRQQQAEVANDQVALAQAQQNYAAQTAAAQAAVSDAQAKVDAADATIASAQAGVNSARANLTNAQATYNRTYSLYKQGYVSAQEVDNARTALRVQQEALSTAQAQLRAAQSARASAVAQLRAAEQQQNVVRTNGTTAIEAARTKLAQAQSTLATAQANRGQIPSYQQNLAALRATVNIQRAALANTTAQLADTVLSSPLNGVVTTRFQDPGALATPSQPILELQAVDTVWAVVSVPDVVATRLHIGQTAFVTFDVYPERTFAGKVGQINPAADVLSRQYVIRVALSNRQRLFRVGMFARVTFETASAAHVTAVPREAVQQDAAGSYVLVITSEETVAHRPVVTGLSDTQYIAILQGVSSGERVVTLSAFALHAGQQVRPVPRGSSGYGAPQGAATPMPNVNAQGTFTPAAIPGAVAGNTTESAGGRTRR